VLLIMTTIRGYGVNGTFGRIPTPALDPDRKGGLRYTQSILPPVLADTAALITGPQPHSAVSCDLDLDGLPGYDSIITPDKATIALSPKATATPHRGSAKPQYRRRPYSVAGPFDQCRRDGF